MSKNSDEDPIDVGECGPMERGMYHTWGTRERGTKEPPRE